MGRIGTVYSTFSLPFLVPSSWVFLFPILTMFGDSLCPIIFDLALHTATFVDT